LDNPVANANELALFINFVRQEPTTAYSASGTTLTLTEATSSSDDMYAIFLGKAIQTVNPPNASVGTAQLINDAVTKDKVSNLMYPAFEVFSNGVTVSIANSTLTKLTFTVEKFDTDSAYNTSTGKFTPQVAGKYFCYGRLAYNKTGDFDNIQIALAKNGSDFSSTLGRNEFYTEIDAYGVADLNGSSDYVELYTKQVSGASADLLTSNQNGSNCIFGAYRIGD
jgi:hypothetical protein